MQKDLHMQDIVSFMDKIAKKNINETDMEVKLISFIDYLCENDMIDERTHEMLGLLIYVNKDLVFEGKTTFADEYKGLLDAKKEDNLNEFREALKKISDINKTDFTDPRTAFKPSGCGAILSPGCTSSSTDRCGASQSSGCHSSEPTPHHCYESTSRCDSSSSRC